MNMDRVTTYLRSLMTPQSWNYDDETLFQKSTTSISFYKPNRADTEAALNYIKTQLNDFTTTDDNTSEWHKQRNDGPASSAQRRT